MNLNFHSAVGCEALTRGTASTGQKMKSEWIKVIKCEPVLLRLTFCGVIFSST